MARGLRIGYPANGAPFNIPAAGMYDNISLNTLESVKPTGWPVGETAGPCINWVGAVFASDFGTLGGIVCFGSGHLTPGSPTWAGVWVFDIATQRWVGRNVPAAPLIEPTVPERETLYNDWMSTEPATLGHPYPPHTYDGLVYVPAVWAGNSSGFLLKFFWPGASNSNNVICFDLDSTTAPATIVVPSVPMQGSSSQYPMTAWDEGRHGVWALSANGTGPLSFVDVTDWSVVAYDNPVPIGYNTYGDNSLALIPGDGSRPECLLGFGRANSGNTQFDVYCCPIVGGVPQGFAQVTTTGTPPADGRSGGVWSPRLGAMVCYAGDGATTVQKLTPPADGDVLNSDWTWTSQSFTGVGGIPPAQAGINPNNLSNYEGNGSWSRFLEVPDLEAFFWYASVSGAVQCWNVT